MTASSSSDGGTARVAGILLAAGASSRMGEPKQLLDWCGEPLLVYQRRQLEEAGLEPVVVVLGARFGELRDVATGGAARATRIVENSRWEEGKATSIRRGIAEVAGDVAGVLILAVDQPRPARLLRALVAGHVAGGGLISVPVFRGRRGHPPLFSAELLPELRAVREERQGLREVLGRHARDVLEVDLSDPLVLADLNTPEEYRRAVSSSGDAGARR